MGIRAVAWRQGKRAGRAAWGWLRAQPPVARRVERLERALDAGRLELEGRLSELERELFEWAQRLMDEARARAEAAGGAASGASARPTLQESYQLLGLPYGAPLAETKRAWREKMLSCHPDRFPNDPARQASAEREAREVNLAFQVIREALER